MTICVDYNSLNDEVLQLNPKIRYAGVYHTGIVQLHEKMQKGITRLFDKEKTQDTFIHAYMRWKTRQHDSSVIGEPVYTMTKYGKINRLTIPCSSKALLMVNTEPELEPHEIVDDVIKLIKKYSDDPNYTPKQVYLG
ncbi:MAG: hypothetical protein ACR2LL_02305 [Nitrosopumilus sp.]|uniref:hypothetical protein n=1 Tax=Nitrosopumilus sp. TaxID=2024843 RepID=UPI00292FF2E6|nr:hypothetical protein [Nitrosopumilus sp.]